MSESNNKKLRGQSKNKKEETKEHEYKLKINSKTLSKYSPSLGSRTIIYEEEDQKTEPILDEDLTDTDEETDTDDEFSLSVRQVRKESRERASQQKSPKSQTRNTGYSTTDFPSSASSFNRSLPPKKEKNHLMKFQNQKRDVIL